MQKAQRQIKAFMQLAQQATPMKPITPSLRLHDFRTNLIKEEAQEFADAKDLVQAADAIGDLLYVTIGTAIAYGIDIDPIFQEIHRSNMSKFIDGRRREDGKWIKGPSYSPAKLKPIIEAQQRP